MLGRYWFQVDRGLGYGVTAMSTEDAHGLLAHHGYPRIDERITGVIEDVALTPWTPRMWCATQGL